MFDQYKSYSLNGEVWNIPVAGIIMVIQKTGAMYFSRVLFGSETIYQTVITPSVTPTTIDDVYDVTKAGLVQTLQSKITNYQAVLDAI